MHTAFKILGVLAVLALAAFLTVIIVVERTRAKSKREITHIVSQIRPGMPLHHVTALGPIRQTITNATNIVLWGTTKEDKIVTNSVLNMFIHNAIPFRWICVYTDHQSNVVYASWKDM